MTCIWAAELTPAAGEAAEIVDEQVNVAGSISTAAVIDMAPDEIVEGACRTEYASLDTVFERVIGLGHICTTKGQINNYFSPGAPLMKTKKGHADLFDWLFIYDYNLLANALSNKLVDIFEKDDFIKTARIENKAVFNKRYNMQWNHLFDNRIGAYSAHNTSNWNQYVSLEYFHDHFDETRSKIDHLREKFISAKNQKTLYIISHPQTGPTFETLVRVRDSLTTIRQGDKQFAILFVPNSQTYEGAENIIVREAIKLKDGWNGANPARWHEILSEFKFTPDIWT